MCIRDRCISVTRPSRLVGLRSVDCPSCPRTDCVTIDSPRTVPKPARNKLPPCTNIRLDSFLELSVLSGPISSLLNDVNFKPVFHLTSALDTLTVPARVRCFERKPLFPTPRYPSPADFPARPSFDHGVTHARVFIVGKCLIPIK